MREGFNGSRALVLPQMIVNMMEHDALIRNLFPTDIGFYPNAAHHSIERLQPINQHVLIYCVNGRGNFWIINDEGKKEEHAVETNQYFILPAGHAHGYRADKQQPWTIYWIHFTGAMSQLIAQEFTHTGNTVSYAPRTIRPELHSRISTRNQLFEELYHVLECGYVRENLVYASAVLNHYLSSFNNITAFRRANTEQEIDTGNFVEAAIHYMRENIDKKLKLEQIAHYTGFSSSHFSAIFRRATGHAPVVYFNIMKMQEACRLLDETNMHINQICYKVGIEDYYYFSRLFHKVMGVSPTEYRTVNKG